jgi:predicted GNAT superfamily acetyltransferase
MKGESAGASIREATPPDFGAILALNAESEHFLSPLARERLAQLHGDAAYCRIAWVDDRPEAFLLAFREGAAYDSPNYRWFAERHDRFLYIDRVVVSLASQGMRLGTLLYEDLFAFARQSRVPRVTCEFDVDPPNPVSARFHARFGFNEAGQQIYGAMRKRVSMQEVLL